MPFIFSESDHYTVDPASGCWLWVRSTNAKGYPTLGGSWARRTGRSILAHRVAAEDAVGPIPEGHTVDHVCRTRSCVNPEHLDVVPHRVNVRRGSRTKLTNDAVRSILRHAAEGTSTTPNARVHGVSITLVREVVAGRSWGDVSSPHRAAARSRSGQRPCDHIANDGKPYPPGCAT